MSFTKYVMMIVMDPEVEMYVGITKKKGPSFLINKLTFPGGKVEENETSVAAASREMLEETGIVVPVENWKPIYRVDGFDYSMEVFSALSGDVLKAQTKEEEPVWQMSYARQLEYAAKTPQEYAPDFIPLLSKALKSITINELRKYSPECIKRLCNSLNYLTLEGFLYESNI